MGVLDSEISDMGMEIAASSHVPGKESAKTALVKLDGVMAVAVLSATRRLDLSLMKQAAGAAEAELASDREFADTFGDCDLGTIPPFGNLFGMEVYVNESLTEDEEIAFNAGSHTELLRMHYADYERLVKPKVATLSR